MLGQRVVITGLGALTPIGNNVQQYKEALFKGVSGAAPIKQFDCEKFKTQFACELKDFNPEDFLSKKEVRKLDPFVHYAICVADEAIKNANIDFDSLDRSRIGIIWASGIGGLKTFFDEIVNFAKGDGTPRLSPFFIPKMILNIASGHLSIRYGLHGPSYATVSACASSNHALIDALNLIRLRQVDMVICGGAEAIINEAGIGGFNACQALSLRNDSPETASRPFDKDRDGFVAGEGAGCMIVESLEHAKKRGATIHAEFVGGGMSSDAYHMTAPHPEGIGAELVMHNAIQDAGLSPQDIDYINVHGTSTPLGDVQELKAIINHFGSHAYNLHISSTKSMTGHLLGAAGVIEAIASIFAIQEGIIPPTINHFTDDPEIDSRLNLTFNKAQKREVNYALSNTFGFGGHNTSVIFKKYTP